MDAVVSPLKELTHHRGSPPLQVYHRIGNATNLGDWAPARQIRALGGQRICQFHFKDKGYLGEGNVDVKAALGATRELGFEGHMVLETGAPSNLAAGLERPEQQLRVRCAEKHRVTVARRQVKHSVLLREERQRFVAVLEAEPAR